MKLYIEAACACNRGNVRKNNEDNFFFQGIYLPVENNGLDKTIKYEAQLGKKEVFCVFDGIGGECYGEVASHVAAICIKKNLTNGKNFFETTENYLKMLCHRLNEAVVFQKKEYKVSQMGTTMAVLYMTPKWLYALNIGDSRIYRLKDGKLSQLSKDHSLKRANSMKKAPITQYLGLDLEEMEIDPYIVKLPMEKGDAYLICSDGLTDMVTDIEIEQIMTLGNSAEDDVNNLIVAALEHGGRDNVTAIICKIR